MNDLQIFNSEEFGEIRTITKDNEPMFCLADVCKALELEQVSRVKARLKADGVTTSKVIDRLGREQEATFINESNLYKTIFQSRKDSAERFTDWVKQKDFLRKGRTQKIMYWSFTKVKGTSIANSIFKLY